jgi:hypothetical protein
LTGLKLDVALVQEAVPPSDVHAVYHRGGIGKHRWGSAVVSCTGELRELERVRSPHGGKGEVELMQALPGSVLIAEREGEPTVFVSAYDVMEGSYAVTTMHRILTDLTPTGHHGDLCGHRAKVPGSPQRRPGRRPRDALRLQRTNPKPPRTSQSLPKPATKSVAAL